MTRDLPHGVKDPLVFDVPLLDLGAYHFQTLLVIVT
jgi:hypothetical protein